MEQVFLIVQVVLGCFAGSSIGFLLVCWLPMRQSYQIYLCYLNKTLLARIGRCLFFFLVLMAASIHFAHHHGWPRRASTFVAVLWAALSLLFFAWVLAPSVWEKIIGVPGTIVCCWLSVFFLPHQQPMSQRRGGE